MINIYYDIASDKRVDSLGGNSISDLILKYQTTPTWRINFLEVDKAAGTTEPLDLSSVVSWSAAVDDDFDHDSAPMCRTLNADIDASQAADGIIDVPIDANTETFETAIGESELKREVFFELVGYDTNGDKVQSALIKIVAKNSVDPAGTTPLPVPDNFVTEAQLAAYVAGAWEIQYSIDGATLWHDEQAEEDRYIRLRPDNGIDWTDGILLVTGPKGDDGAAATIAVGTVTTGDAGSSVIVTNSGTEAAAVFDFTIPQGNTGAAGANGVDGADGADAPETKIQYSSDNASFHDTWVSGDVYIRFSTDGGSTWTTGKEFTSSGVNSDVEFDNGDLTAGVLTVSGTRSIVAIVDNSGKVIFPDEITYGATDTTVDLTSFGTLTGTWKVIFAQGKDGADGAAGADGDMTNPMTTAGDIIYGGTDGAPARLAKGAAGQVLKMNSGATSPEWGDAVSSGGSDGAAITLTDNRTMTAAEVGKHFEYTSSTAATKTLTLATPPVNNSAPVWIKNSSSYNITVSGHINGAASTSFTLYPDSTIKLISEGSTWRIVMERWEPSAAASSHTFASLDGNTDRRYEIASRVIANGTTGQYQARLNNDSGSNYKTKSFAGYGSTDQENNSQTWTGFDIGFTGDSTQSFNTTEIFAKTGANRIAKAHWTRATDSVTQGIGIFGEIWLNTTDNITSIVVAAPSGGNFGVGSCVELWKLAQ